MSDASGARARVLVVEDDPDLRELWRQVLERAGFAVETSASGRDAAPRCRAERFDLVLTDIVMPDMDGFELLQQLARDVPTTAVIAISGGGALGDRTYLKVAERLGARAVISKPVRVAQLLAAVEGVLAGGAGSGQ